MSKCLKCGSKTATLDTRPTKRGDTWRRRECMNQSCKFRFSTLEIPNGPHPRCAEVADWAAQNNRDIYKDDEQ